VLNLTENECIYLHGDPLILHVNVTGSPSSVTRLLGSSVHSGALTGVSLGSRVPGGCTWTVKEKEIKLNSWIHKWAV